MIIMNEEITKDPYDNNVQRNYKRPLWWQLTKKLQKTHMMIMYEEITKDTYDNDERRNYKRPIW